MCLFNVPTWLRARLFYDRVLAPLGGSRAMDFGEVVGYGLEGKPEFWIGPLVSGGPNRENHLAFRAKDRASVRAFFDAAVALGARCSTSRVRGPSTTSTTTGRSCAIPTGTTWKPSATTPSSPRTSDPRHRQHQVFVPGTR